jgi:putative oxidoreductase
MSLPPALVNGRDLGLRLAAALAFLPPLLTRLVMGTAFYQTGSGKLAHPERVAAFFAELGIPFPELNAAFTSRVEYYGGILLVLGLLTRLAAALLGATMSVALMTADRGSLLEALSFSGETGLTDVVPVVYGLFMLWLLICGPGPLSLDHLLTRWLGIDRPAKARAGGEPPAAS